MENDKVNEVNLCVAMIYYIISIMPEERLNLEEIVRILDKEMDIVEKNIVQFPTGNFAKIYYDKLSNLKKEEFDNVVTNLKNKIIKCKDDKIFHNAIMVLSSDEQVNGLANCIIEYKEKNSNEIREEETLKIYHRYPISEHIIENVGMVCQDNPEYKSFFEEQKKHIIEEMMEAKDIATIKERKISEYLATIKNSEEFYNIVVAMGEASIYNINYNLKDNKMIYSMEIDNLGLFRTVLIYYIIGILYYWTAERLPITVEITIEKKFEEIFETMRADLNIVQKMIKGIEEFRIIYK